MDDNRGSVFLEEVLSTGVLERVAESLRNDVFPNGEPVWSDDTTTYDATLPEVPSSALRELAHDGRTLDRPLYPLRGGRLCRSYEGVLASLSGKDDVRGHSNTTDTDTVERARKTFGVLEMHALLYVLERAGMDFDMVVTMTYEDRQRRFEEELTRNAGTIPFCDVRRTLVDRLNQKGLYTF